MICNCSLPITACKNCNNGINEFSADNLQKAIDKINEIIKDSPALEVKPCNAYFAIKNVNGTVSTWVPSINDCLADDWYVVL